MDPTPDDGTTLNDLVQECAARWAEHGPQVLDALCAAHPRHAPALRRRIDLLLRGGMLDDRQPAGRLGDFRLLDQLGAGGMGIVYRAEQASLGRQVALKVIRPDHSFFADARQRFLREANAVARLQHDGIVPVYLAGEDRGVLYYAMELVEGCTLARALHALRGRDPATLSGADLARAVAAHTGGRAAQGGLFKASTWVECCLRLVQQVAEALEHAHGRGVLHRDVKPSNLMLTLNGRVRLLDFGLASTEDDPRITRSGAQLGSLAYMAPEQVRGDSGAIGRATDVWGAGLVLYEMLALRQPFVRDRSEATRQAVLAARPGSLRAHNRAVSSDAEQVCFKAIDPDPARRYPRAQDFARDIGNVLELRPIEARPPGPWLRARRAAQRRPALALSIAFAAVLVVGVFPALWLQQRAARLRLQEAQARTEAALAEAKAALARAERQEQRARFGLGKAREAVERFLAEVGEFKAVDIPLLEQLRRDLLAQAAALYEQLLHDPQGDPDPALAFEHARTLFALGQVLRELDREAEAVGVLQRVLAALSPAAADARPEVRRLRALAHSALGAAFRASGRVAEAEPHLVAAAPELARVADETGDIRARAAYLRNAIALANLRQDQRRAADAIALFERALRQGGELPRGIETMRVLAEARRGLGLLRASQSEATAAITELEQAVALRREIVQRAPGSARFRRDLCAALEDLGTQLESWFPGRMADALRGFEESAGIATSLVRDFPSHSEYRLEYCRARLQTSRLRSRLGAAAEAERDLGDAVAGLERLRSELPAETGWRLPLGYARYTLAMHLRRDGRDSEAEAELDLAQALLDELRAQAPDDTGLNQQQAELWLARSATPGRPADEAVAYARRAFDLAFPFLAWQRTDASLYGTAYRCFAQLVDLLCARGDYAAALQAADAYAGQRPYKWACQLALARTYLRCRAGLADADDAAEVRECCLHEARAAIQRGAEHSLRAVLRIEEDPMFAPLRGDPAIEDLLARARVARG